MLTERREVARRFMKVYAETIDWMYANQRESVAFYANMNKVPVEVAQRGVEFYPKKALALAPIHGLQLSLDQALQDKAIDKKMTVQEAEKMLDFVHRPAGG
jgi:ABC-type nitrate/sulfonate/bicarbonate transport system substrate-binding protein